MGKHDKIPTLCTNYRMKCKIILSQKPNTQQTHFIIYFNHDRRKNIYHLHRPASSINLVLFLVLLWPAQRESTDQKQSLSTPCGCYLSKHSKKETPFRLGAPVWYRLMRTSRQFPVIFSCLSLFRTCLVKGGSEEVRNWGSNNNSLWNLEIG